MSAFHYISESNETHRGHRCPCCYFRTLHGRGEICPVCFWKDNGQDDEGVDAVRSGTPDGLSLLAARKNFQEFGASDLKHQNHVRMPHPDEV